jgi:hypothetical protein
VAKDKPTKSSKPRSVSAKRKAPAPKPSGSAKPEQKPASSSDAAFTGITIGHAAGEVWACLSDGPRTIAEIQKSNKAPGDVVIAAIGWLAREDKLEFITSGKTVKIGLR